MYWYVIHVKNNLITDMIDTLNKNEDIFAFIPRVERWHSIGNGQKDYILKDLYPGYIFIRSCLNEDEMNEYYKELFSLVNTELLSFYFNDEQANIFNQVFNNEGIIKHSIGNIRNKILICDSGPLVGLEDMVIKVDRHHRFAKLDFQLFGSQFIMPVEVVSKT